MRHWPNRAERSALAAALAVVVLGGCGPQPFAATEKLATDQTLVVGLHDDPSPYDPAILGCYPDGILHNIFDGLYSYDQELNLVPALATSLPTVSADGRTYSFHLRTNARFSNGDPVTAADAIYSWTRTAKTLPDQGVSTDYWPIVGYAEFLAGTSTSISGLASPDAHTVVATLTAPAGHWLRFLALPLWSIVDQRVVVAAGDSAWTTPEDLVGTGPFKMTARDPGHSIDFEPESRWWGGSTGSLKHIHVNIAGDSLVTDFRSHKSDLVSGFLCWYNKVFDVVTQLTKDPSLPRGELNGMPTSGTWFVRFGAASGPFAGSSGKDGRIAFSEAIDRTRLVTNSYPFAVPATGGPVPNGMHGYLGDGADPYAHFDPRGARVIYRRWDPDGSKVKGLTYVYNYNPMNDRVARELQAQWRLNLGVDIAIKPVDTSTFFHGVATNSYPLSRLGWQADFDSPQNFYANSSLNLVPPSDSSILNLGRQADTQPYSPGLATYKRAGRLFVDGAAAISLMYLPDPYLVHSYVRGAGGNGFVEDPWRGIRILQH